MTMENPTGNRQSRTIANPRRCRKMENHPKRDRRGFPQRQTGNPLPSAGSGACAGSHGGVVSQLPHCHRPAADGSIARERWPHPGLAVHLPLSPRQRTSVASPDAACPLSSREWCWTLREPGTAGGANQGKPGTLPYFGAKYPIPTQNKVASPAFHLHSPRAHQIRT